MNNRSLFGCRFSLFFLYAQQHIVLTSPIYGLYVHKFSQTSSWSLLQDNSLLRYTLYTSSVQDLYLPQRFLLQRQSYAFCQGWCLEAINQFMISFFILLAPSNTLVSLLNLRACMHLYRLLNQSIPEQQWALF